VSGSGPLWHTRAAYDRTAAARRLGTRSCSSLLLALGAMIRQRTPLTPLTPHVHRQTDRQTVGTRFRSARLGLARQASPSRFTHSTRNNPTIRRPRRRLPNGERRRTADALCVCPAVPAAPPHSHSSRMCSMPPIISDAIRSPRTERERSRAALSCASTSLDETPYHVIRLIMYTSLVHFHQCRLMDFSQRQKHRIMHNTLHNA